MTRNSAVSKLFGVLLIFVLLFSALPMGEAFASSPSVFINEIHYDNDSTDAGETIEIAGPAGTDLSGWSLVLYNGNGGAVYNTTVLVGTISDQQNGYGTLMYAYPVNGIQNGSPDGVALVNGSTVVQFLSYEGTFTAIGGPADGMTSVDIGVSEPYSTLVGHSLQLAGSGTTYDDFTWAAAQANTFGAVNADQTFGGSSVPVIIINEVDSDTPSYDALEFIEFYDGGTGNTALDGLVLVLFNGSDDLSYMPVFDLDGYTTNADGYFVIGTVAEADLYVAPGTYGWLQNGADAVALLVGDAVDFPNDTLITTDGLLDAIVYDTNDGDDAALLGLLNTGQPQVNEDGSSDKDNHSNQRCPNGEGGARNTDAYTQSMPTPGSANDCSPPVTVTTIYDIQYTTDSSGDSPYKNQSDITTEGIVTALFYNNYYIEDPAGGAWNGLFVYDYENTPSLGDYVRVTGAVSEYYNLTQLKSVTDFEVVSSGNAIPAPAILSTGDVAEEQWEGVLVRVENVSVSDDNLGYGEWSVNDGSGDVVLDDQGSYTYSPAIGDALRYVVGVLDYSYGAFKMQPRTDSDIKLSACNNAYTPIYSIQGDGFSSPLDGTLVDVEGIVTGDFQDGKSVFTFQDAIGDGNTATSDGVFVYAPSPDVNVGDHVRVTGYVDEYYGLTEITGVSDLEVCSTGNAVAATPISLPVMDTSDLEVYEGMLITFPQSLYISEYFNFGRYGEIVLSTDRQFQPTAIFDPGSVDAAQMLANNLLNRIKLDDGRGSQNSDPALHPNGSIFDMSNLFRGGDILNNLTGIVDYNYGEYKIQATSGADYVNANPRTAQPDAVGGNLTVASFNVLNYFTTLGERGADTAEEFDRQRAKIFAALAAMDADVVGLIEIENNTAAIQNLVDGLNALVGAGTYAYLDTGMIGDDAIKVAFIYKTATVSLVGDYAILDSSVDSRFIDSKNRPALAQTFMDNANGGIFTAAVNHLKSKGSSCDDLGDPDLGDGAGNCNLTRTAAAEALVDWLATDPTNSGDADFLIMGDLNAYDKEDPIDAILAGGYTDLVYQYLGENAYSYVFDGQLGYLDHALANGELAPEISGVTIWHINTDEASLIDYDMTYKKDAQDAIYAPDAYRSSDHDPVVIGMNVCDEIVPTLEVALSTTSLWPVNHKYVDVTATVTATDNFDTNPTITLFSVTSNEPDDGLGDGDTPDDIVIVDDFTFELRAERSGLDGDRVYTITYQVTDACGNSTIATATVIVPHNQ